MSDREDIRDIGTPDGKSGITVGQNDAGAPEIPEGDAEQKRIKFGFDADFAVRTLTHALIAVLALVMVIYMCYHLFTDFDSTYTTAAAYPASEQEYISAEGYIVRKEYPLVAEKDGGIYYAVADGERVSAGQTVAEIMTGAVDNAAIERLEGELLLLRRLMMAGAPSESVLDVQKNISKEYGRLTEALASGNIREALSASDELRVALGRFNYLSGGEQSYRDAIEKAEYELAMLRSSLGESIERISDQRPGYYYRECDGYEEIFTPRLVDMLGSESFKAALSAEPSVAQGSVGKLVTDPEWQMIVPLSPEHAKRLSEGESYEVIFNDNRVSIEMTLYKVVEDGDEAYAVFSTERMPEGFAYSRLQSIEIRLATYAGYRVPASAMRFVDGMSGVYVIDAGIVRFRQVDVLYTGNGYCLVADYETAEPDPPTYYRYIDFDTCFIDRIRTPEHFAEAMGLSETVRTGIGVPYGEKIDHYYHLGYLEDIIVSGTELYDGKVAE